MKKLIEQIKQRPLSSKVLSDYTNVRVILYPELNNIYSLEELFNGDRSVILLYLQNPRFGHYCCLNILDNNVCEFFDPYGYFIDDQLAYTEDDMKEILNQKLPLLSKMLRNNKTFILSYNEYQFQEKKKNVNTCGRHCIWRLKNLDKTLNQYKKCFDNLKHLGNPDDIVSIMTREI